MVWELSRAGSGDHTKEQSYENGRVDRDRSISEPVEEDGSRLFGRIEFPNCLLR